MPFPEMKTLLTSIIALLVAASANAQHLSQSFLREVRSIQVTNGIPLTNIVSFTGMTNIQGTVWTNNSGTRMEVTAAGNTVRYFSDVRLFTDKEGKPVVYYYPQINGLTNYAVSGATLNLRVQGGSGANSAVTFVFTPLWDGETPPLVTTDDWSVAITAVVSAQTTLATNVPLWKWPGAKALRLKSVVNADTDASSGVFVNQVQLNAFVP